MAKAMRSYNEHCEKEGCEPQTLASVGRSSEQERRVPNGSVRARSASATVPAASHGKLSVRSSADLGPSQLYRQQRNQIRRAAHSAKLNRPRMQQQRFACSLDSAMQNLGRENGEEGLSNEEDSR